MDQGVYHTQKVAVIGPKTKKYWWHTEMQNYIFTDTIIKACKIDYYQLSQVSLYVEPIIPPKRLYRHITETNILKQERKYTSNKI